MAKAKFRIIVAGGRDLPVNDKSIAATMKAIKQISKSPNHVELFTGMARGADQLPVHIFHKYGMAIRRFPAKWTDEHGKYNPEAGFERNHEMGDEATHLIAFWDGMSSGTKDMIAYAKSKGLVVFVIRYTIKRVKPKTLTPFK